MEKRDKLILLFIAAGVACLLVFDWMRGKNVVSAAITGVAPSDAEDVTGPAYAWANVPVQRAQILLPAGLGGYAVNNPATDKNAPSMFACDGC